MSDPSKLGIERHKEKISHYKISTLYDSIHKLLQNFIHKICLLSRFIHNKPQILIVPQFEICFYNLSLFDISYFLFLSLPSSFPLS